MAPAIVKSRLRGSVVPVTCPHCKAELEYDKASIPSTSSNAFQISCCRCVRTFEPASTSASKARSQASSTAAAAAGRRRIGTQASPLDTSYYDILQVPVDADTDAIKKSYRKLALKHHPDKLSADKRTPEADEVFKQISVAYTVLSNPEERKKYNEFGPASKQQENGFVDPEEVFSSLFGGERFEDIIGKVSIGAEMKASLQREHDQQEKESGAQGGSGAVDGGEGSAGSSSSSKAAVKARKDMTPEEREADRKEREAKRAQEKAEAAERARVREERVSELYAKLMKKIAIFTEQAASPLDQEVSRSVRAIWAIEADELKEESYGVELLHAVGEVYLQRSQQYVASHNTVLGFGGWWSGMKNTANVFSDTISTLRSAYELTDVFKELAAADEKGLSEEKRKELEEKAATKGMQALFKGCKLEIESVVREVCERVLYEEGITRDQADKRAAALEILGGVYSSVKKDEPSTAESDYVKVDPKPQPNR